MAAHRVSPKSSFLNAPRGLILYLIDPIMTSDECRRLCAKKYADFLTRIPLFPQLSVLALPVYIKLWYILDWINEVPHYRCEHLRHKINLQTRNTWSFLFLLFIYVSFSVPERIIIMFHVYLMEFHVNIAIVWY